MSFYCAATNALCFLFFLAFLVLQQPPARVVGFKVEPFSVRHTYTSPGAKWAGGEAPLPPLDTCDDTDSASPVKMPKVYTQAHYAHATCDSVQDLCGPRSVELSMMD